MDAEYQIDSLTGEIEKLKHKNLELQTKVDLYFEEKEMEDNCVTFVKHFVITRRKDQAVLKMQPTTVEEYKQLVNQLILDGAEMSNDNKEISRLYEQERKKAEEYKSQLDVANEKLKILTERFSDEPENGPSTPTSPTIRAKVPIEQSLVFFFRCFNFINSHLGTKKKKSG